MYIEIGAALFAIFLLILLIVMLRFRNRVPVAMIRFRGGQTIPNNGVATHIGIKINPMYKPGSVPL